MVGKLLKHELFSIFRVIVYPVIVMLALAAISRILMIGEDVTAVASVFVMFYIFAIVATLFACACIGVSRFYKTLFTGEGYMTMSLPATADQLICAKLLSAIIAFLFGFMACVLGGAVFTAGDDVLWTMLYDILEGFWSFYVYFPSGSDYALALAECILLGILQLPFAFLFSYLVMCIGQLFTTKNRSAVSFVLYIVIIFVWSIIFSLAGEPFIEFVSEISVHLMLWIEIVFVAAVSAGCYFAVRYILSHKLNLVG